MAYATGSATGPQDALNKLRLFLTTDSTLVAAGQAWKQLRWIVDNVEAVDTTIGLSAGAQAHKLFRPDFRTQNYVAEADASNCLTGSFEPGQWLRAKLRTARAVTRFTLKAPPDGYLYERMPRDFELQYSSNGTSWTTALAVTDQVDWSANEERSFTVPSATGTWLWWRLVTVWTGSNSGGSDPNWALRSLWLYDGDELVSSSESNLVLKGPGLSGDDKVFVAFRTSYDTAAGESYILVNGMTGFLPAQQSLNVQPGLHPKGWPVVPTWSAAMPYRFVGSGRRVVFVLKVSTVFEAGYAGLYLPYASPEQFPYPLAIGGSAAPDSPNYRYDSVSAAHSCFVMPGGVNGLTGSTPTAERATLAVMLPDGSWLDVQNRPSSGGGSESNAGYLNSPATVLPHSSFGYGFRENIGGGFSVFPAVVLQRLPGARFLGELDGCFLVSGFGNGSENTGVIDGDDYLVVQNTYRTDAREYWALKTE